MATLGHILFGLVVGIVARIVFPGANPGGIIVTILLGMAGAWLGGYIGRVLGWYPEGHSAGFVMAVVGALILLLGYHLIFGRAKVTPGPLQGYAPVTIVTQVTG